MKIYSMTATFGKLEHRTLTLQPGLNIIEAPNEWGKSTWCAFLVNMLYGIDTRARTTGSALAEKEKYAPWSGSPMAGRIDLNWNGKDITIERRTKGRVIFGEFRAYETATGIDIPELNSVNCGQTLLGVERSVFTRAGFLRLSDLPVTQDDSLRRRLNNLVTTGDESGAGDKLGKALKELKNKCRHNRTGLLPQAEAEREQLTEQLRGLHSLGEKADALRIRQEQLEIEIALLQNHRDALQYEASLADIEKIAGACAARDQLQLQVDTLAAQCSALASQQEAQKAVHRGQTLQEQWMALQMETQMLPDPPQPPHIPERYRELGPEDAVSRAQEDFDRWCHIEHRRKKQGKLSLICLICAAVLCLGFLAAGILASSLFFLGSGVVALAAALILVLCALRSRRFSQELDGLYQRYPALSPDGWVSDANAYAAAMRQYSEDAAQHDSLCQEVEQRHAALKDATHMFTGEQTLAQCQAEWAGVLNAWDALGDARRDLQKAQDLVQTLQSMAKTAAPPEQPDTLTFPSAETDARLNNARYEQRQLHQQLGKIQGQAEALGQAALLKARLDTLNRRIAQLEDTYYALELAQDSLHQASITLQRRFAPRISKRAQELFHKLTEGRYQRVALGEDLSLSASAEEESTLRSAQWRSDGTVDQLYLALRLAVAEALTPEAPLVLDDALVRYDDRRLKIALDILKEEAQHKQVLLFTCQSRENALQSRP